MHCAHVPSIPSPWFILADSHSLSHQRKLGHRKANRKKGLLYNTANAGRKAHPPGTRRAWIGQRNTDNRSFHWLLRDRAVALSVFTTGDVVHSLRSQRDSSNPSGEFISRRLIAFPRIVPRLFQSRFCWSESSVKWKLIQKNQAHFFFALPYNKERLTKYRVTWLKHDRTGSWEEEGCQGTGNICSPGYCHWWRGWFDRWSSSSSLSSSSQ